MKKNKLRILLAIVLIALAIVFTSCSQTANVNDERLNVVCTIFPQYDFVRQIAGEYVDVMILLSPGVESHTYEPTPFDIKKINDADLFIYTGKYMEPWAQSIVDSIDSRRTVVVDASKDIELMDTASHHNEESKHLYNHDNENENYDSGENSRHHHKHGADPHIWLDPILAETMVDNITNALCDKDEKHSEFYKEKASDYKNKLDKLDNDFCNMIDSAKKDTIVIAGHFAYAYLFNRYNIDYISAYDSCSTHDEPSIKKIIEIVDYIKSHDLDVVYHEQLVDPKVAKSVASQTGVELAVLHTGHNLSENRMRKGMTYLDVMYENLESLRKGLN